MLAGVIGIGYRGAHSCCMCFSANLERSGPSRFRKMASESVMLVVYGALVLRFGRRGYVSGGLRVQSRTIVNREDEYKEEDKNIFTTTATYVAANSLPHATAIITLCRHPRLKLSAIPPRAHSPARIG